MLTIQPSFAKGEMGPEVYGRIDIQAYQSGLAKAYNCLIHPYGGVSNRPGTTFIGPIKDHTNPVRLIPFQFKTTDSYILEFGNLYMRIIRNDAHVTETPLNITAITQASPAVVTVATHGYSNGDEVFIASVGGMVGLNGRRFIVAGVTTNTFQLTDQVSGVPISTISYPAYTSGGTSGRIYTVVSPYLSSELFELKYVQNADVMTLTHRNHPATELSRLGNANWTFKTIVFGPSITRPTGISVSVGTTGAVTYSYKVTGLKTDTLEESLPGLNTVTRTITAITKANPATVTSNAHGFSNGQEIYINNVVGMTQVNDLAFTITNVTTNTFDLLGINSTGYTTYVSGGTANQTFVTITNGAVTANNTISWAQNVNAIQYKIYKFSNGAYGLIGQTQSLSFTDNGITASSTNSVPVRRDPLSTDNPIAVSYYEQRRVFGGSTNSPDTTWYTQVGNTSNMNASQPAASGDAFNAKLTADQVNEIRHFVPQTSLLGFTSGGEWRIDAGLSDAFSFSTIKQKPQSSWGSSYIRPLVVNSTVLFIPDSRRHIRSFGYSYTVDKYTGDDLTVLAPHLFKSNQIIDWCYAITDDSRLYMIRDDGFMLTLTFDQEQEVVAWTQCQTDGWFESIASIKNPSGAIEPEDAIYLEVKRFINGHNVRYIEKLHTRRFDRVEYAYFVDCGLSYDNPITISNVALTNPAIITATGHGLTTGQGINIRDILWEVNVDKFQGTSQPSQINDNTYIVTVTDANTFTIPVDATAFNLYISGGEARILASKFIGLDFLEGEEVVALGDGSVIRDLVVTNGTITLDAQVATLHIGKPYISDVQTLNIQQGQGSIQGRMKKISKIVVRLQDSRGLLVGPSNDPKKLTEMKFRQFENYGQPTQLITGDKEIIEYPSWNLNGQIYLRQKDPLPMTILAVMPDLILDDPQ